MLFGSNPKQSPLNGADSKPQIQPENDIFDKKLEIEILQKTDALPDSNQIFKTQSAETSLK